MESCIDRDPKAEHETSNYVSIIDSMSAWGKEGGEVMMISGSVYSKLPLNENVLKIKKRQVEA